MLNPLKSLGLHRSHAPISILLMLAEGARMPPSCNHAAPHYFLASHESLSYGFASAFARGLITWCVCTGQESPVQTQSLLACFI